MQIEDRLELLETQYEKRGHIALITLTRDKTGHAISTRLCDEMLQIWTDFKNDPDAWVAIVTATGTRFFCTGVDVHEIRTKRMGNAWLPVARLMQSIDKPIICAINGVCCGGGLHFVCDSDIIIGSEHAEFFDPHVNVGMVSGWEPIGLSRRIPLGYVMRMILEGKSYRIKAEEALRIGLITEIVPAERLVERAEEIARMIATNAPIAVRLSKQAALKGLNLGMYDALDIAEYMLKEIWDTEDFEEGKRAFTEHRPPVWKGR